MLDVVPLRCAGRQVTHGDLEAGLAGEVGHVDLPAASAITVGPPWDELGADDYLPAVSSAGSGENASEPLAEETMGGLES
ncbi:hypothetical protein N8I84_40940 [Streptomyces cynarae]|uniref:Uncharacterized protein n=1 Tax=Streptomyces cynarae TaxID=2981134 RepID=A0ABY6EEJ7_9ACTN|nr:hypothetical protein [Streptomyces cynarae]UXY24323.1 hypothetical protein N8I84_40940 [Streptomyces cynarae]